MQLLFATSNPHKIEEVQAILAPLEIHIIGLDAFDNIPDEPVEDGETFQDNARIKAVYYAAHLKQSFLADDSGLEVDALSGKPGVHSARFAAGENDNFFDLPRAQRDAANNRKLLRHLKNVSLDKRTARFVCAMCLADPNGNILAESRGTFDGVITDTPRGTNGFGYDPLLYLPDLQCTSAELSPADKNARSHRGAAALQLTSAIKLLLAP
jgi:XTP/dITP diphosphohydrolase